MISPQIHPLMASNFPSGQPILDIDLSTYISGPFSGFVMSTFLLGCNVVLAWVYFNRNRDTWFLRATVIALIAFNIASTVVNTLVMHWVLIKHYGNLLSLASPESIYYQSGDTLARSIVMFIVHIFFISRVYILNRVHRALPYFMLLCALLVLAFNLAITIYMFMNPDLASLTSDRFEMFMIVRCTLAALVDITVTAAFLWSFRTSKTGFKRTDTLLRRLLKYTVTRGVLVTVMQISLFSLYIAKKDTLDWAPVAYIESEIYIMTMLVMLNSRPAHEKGGVVNVSAELASGRTDSDTSGSGEVEGESAYTLSNFPKSSVGHDKGIIITRQQMVTTDVDV